VKIWKKVMVSPFSDLWCTQNMQNYFAIANSKLSAVVECRCMFFTYTL